MIPFEKMQFVAVKNDNFVVIKGRIKFTTETQISRLEKISDARLDYLERNMKRCVWSQVYGDVQRPLSELRMLALKFLPYEHLQHAEHLLQQIDAALDSKIIATGDLRQAVQNGTPA